MNNYIYDELYHHGIKGQKWGVRRFQNKDGTRTPAGKKRYSDKDIKQDREKIRKRLSSRLSDTLTGDAKKAYEDNKQIEKRIDHLLRNYEFDGDDGGGGRTAADRKAGAEYMDLSVKYDQNDHVIEAALNKQVTQKLVEKYGQKRINQFTTAGKIKTGAAVVGVVAAIPVTAVAGTAVLAAGSVAISGYVGYQSIKNKVAKRKGSKGDRKNTTKTKSSK